MEQENLKKILACYTIAGLLTSAVFATGCSREEDTTGKPEEQETTQQQFGSEDENSEKSTKPDGTEVQIRGKSG